VVVEYAFGMHIGYAIGWVIGLYVGHFYVEHFEPVYLDDLSQLSYWRLAPYIFARNGAMIGVVVGMIAIAVINNKSLNQRVASLYKDGIDNPNDIAHLLGESVGQIERKMNRWFKNDTHKAARCK
jgi:NhaP-type Na+/H+ or K+/H+ antiporter